jgi:hypothetical protein
MADVGQTGVSGEQSRRCYEVNSRIDPPMEHFIYRVFRGEYHVPCVNQPLYSPEIESH